MSLKIEVFSEVVDTRRGIAKGSGNPYTMHSQAAYVYLEGKPFPTEMSLNIEEINGVPQAYPKGVYRLGADSFFVDKYKNLQIKPVLETVITQAKKSA